MNLDHLTQNLTKKIICRPTVFLVAVLAICFLMRAYRLGELFPFTMDEEYHALIAQNSLRTGHIPLIGINAAGTGLYWGPFFAWLNIFLYWVGSGNPMVTAWAAVVLSVASCLLLIRVIQHLTGDYWLGLIGGLLYSVNPLIGMYDHKFWNPSPVIFLSILWLYSIIRSREREAWWWLVLSVFGISFHLHYSLLILLVPTLYELYFQHKTRLKKNKRVFLSRVLLKVLVIFLFFLLPLIMFEIRHDFAQIKGLAAFLASSKVAVQSYWYRLWLLQASFNRFLWLGFNRDLALELSLASVMRSTLLAPVSIVCIGSLIHTIKHSLYRHVSVYICLSLTTYIIALFAYKGPISEYYFLPLFPLMLILGMLSVHLLIRKYGERSEYWLGLVLAVVLVVWSVQSLSIRNSLGMSNKIELMKQIREIVGIAPYRLDAKGRYAFEGYRYLSEWLNVKPAASYMDPHFSWLYTDQINASPERTVTIISNLDKHELTKMEFTDTSRVVKTSGHLLVVN